MKKEFNVVIVGTGGQGLITLLQIIARAALKEGYDVKTSELHGLSQRGGSVEAHIRFGKKIHSPLIPPGKADLVLGLELQESTRAINYSNPKTCFLINTFIVPIPLQKPTVHTQPLSENKISGMIQKVAKNIVLVPAGEICRKELGTNVTAGVFLISFASFKNLIPIKPASILRAIKKIIPEKYLELNKKTFELAKKQ